jgi:serine/threonine protein kinase
VMDFGVERETPFLVMDYAPNGTLRQRHPRGTTLPLAAILSYVKQVADALQYAHDEKFIHRDIKPENMLLGRRNEVLLSDFGIALIAQSSRYQHTYDVAGTVAYMAPEQIQGKPRPASDQYSLAVVVYEWLGGDRPFHGSFTEVCTQHLFAPPPPLREKVPTITPAVEEVVMIALAKDSSQRFKSVQALATALEQASRVELPPGLPIQLSPSSFSTPSVEPSASPPSLPPSPQSSQDSRPSPPRSEEISPPSPSLVPAGISSLSPLRSAESSASPAGDLPLPETNRQTDEGQRAISGSRSAMVKAWQVWGIGKRQVLALVLGVILYGAFNYFLDLLYSNSSSLVTTSLSIFNEDIDLGIVLIGLALIIPLFLGNVFGPWVGLVTIMVGIPLGALLAGYNVSSDYYGASWTWNVGYILIGFIAGLAFLKTQGHYQTARAIALAVAISAIGIIIGTAFITFGEMWVSDGTVDVAWSRFLILILPSTIDLILLPLLLFAYNRLVERIRGA